MRVWRSLMMRCRHHRPSPVTHRPRAVPPLAFWLTHFLAVPVRALAAVVVPSFAIRTVRCHGLISPVLPTFALSLAYRSGTRPPSVPASGVQRQNEDGNASQTRSPQRGPESCRAVFQLIGRQPRDKREDKLGRENPPKRYGPCTFSILGLGGGCACVNASIGACIHSPHLAPSGGATQRAHRGWKPAGPPFWIRCAAAWLQECLGPALARQKRVAGIGARRDAWKWAWPSFCHAARRSCDAARCSLTRARMHHTHMYKPAPPMSWP